MEGGGLLARRPPVREITKERKDDIPMAGRGCGRGPLGNHGRVRACGEPGFWRRPSAQICYLDTLCFLGAWSRRNRTCPHRFCPTGITPA